MDGPAPESRSTTSWLSVAAGALALVLLAVLAFLLYTRAGDELEDRAEYQVRDSATFAAQLVAEQTLRYSELAQRRAEGLRPKLGTRPLERLTPAQRDLVANELREIRAATRGLRSAGLTSPSGNILLTDPPNPELYGRNFAFRDWYQGVTEQRTPYVSRVFRAVTAGAPKTVTVAATIGPREDPLAILTVSLERRTQELVTRFSGTQEIGLVVTDQGGDVVASSGVSSDRIPSRRDDPLVKAALRGESGTSTGGDEIAAYAPVPDIGWTVSARLEKDVALADVRDLRTLSLVLTLIVGLLFTALTTAAILLQRRAERAEAAAAKRRQAVHLHDGVVQTLTIAQAAREAGDHETADKAVSDALEESKRITADLLPENVQPGDLIRPDKLGF